MTTNVARSSSSSHDERCQAASPREEDAVCSSFASVDRALYARLDALEAHPLLRGPLDLIEAREDLDRRLTTLVDAVAVFLDSEY